MGALAPHRQTGPVQMPHGDLQHRIVGTMVDWQGDINVGDFDIPHNPRAVQIQQLVIFCFLLRGDQKRILPLRQPPVIFLGLQEHFVIFFPIQILHLLGIGSHRSSRVQGIPVIAEGWIQQQGHACKKHSNQENGRNMFFHTCRSLLTPAANLQQFVFLIVFMCAQNF